MKGRIHRKKVAEITAMTFRFFHVETNHRGGPLRQFVKEVCEEGRSFAAVKFAEGEFNLSFRRGQQETFCLIAKGKETPDESREWLAEAKNRFAEYGFSFESRVSPNPDELLKTLAAAFGQSPSQIPETDNTP